MRRLTRLAAMAMLLPLGIVGPFAATPASAVSPVQQEPPPGDPPLPEYPGLPSDGAIRSYAVSTTPVPCDNNGADKALTRNQVITRARSWLAVGGVPYSQVRCYRNSYGDYRTDCSGFVSMAWGLGGSGSAFWTGNLMDQAFQISRSSLQPGDALLRHTGNTSENHVALFVRWADGAHTQPVVIEQTGSSGTIERTWSASYAGLYTPIRYDNIGGGGGTEEPAMMRDDGDGSMTIYRWTSSGSAFGRASDYTSGGWTMSNVGDRVASGDVDGDGKDDVVAAYQNSDGTFSFHVWKNGLSYAGKWYTSGPYALGPVDGRLVVADFNGDGKAEPAMMRDDGDGSMTIYRWTSTGSAFSRASDYTSGGWTMANVGNRVASGDVDGDGKDDIVATYQNSDGTFSYHVWKNGVSYAGKWYTSGPYALGPVDGRLVVADLTGDGKAEPAMMRDDGDGSMTIYRWTSSGSAFGRASDYTSGGWTMANVGNRVASGDVDGDGKDDIVATYQNSDGTFSYHVWKNGVSHAGKWYTSGPYALGPVDGRLVLGNWN
ncbi:FG-GAP-like repeat-containing protein [Nonomuraea ferruginea]|uniref:FG-GAP-like repeat-containing protein n=1 Tax=Nonomuraea ferruginea TaxID=46174 RepID=A0ABT4T644_9ACTN|nr:FG-GAP-like repeat-containing protein [Nonomuraea ferruginea]MDA0644976.1 FG-GAP-like repeat-containing protein [Nonomuraea ferruginea]